MPENRSASFEESLARLEEIVRRLESDDVNLEESVTLYEEGRKLVAGCEGQLKSAEERLREAGTAPDAAPAPAGAGAADDELAF